MTSDGEEKMIKNKTKGSAYEEFVFNVYNAINNAEAHLKFETAEIEINKKLYDKNGVERELDIYWKYNLLGQQYDLYGQIHHPLHYPYIH